MKEYEVIAMFKISKDDFLVELRAEIAGYDEITEADEDDFITRVNGYIEAQY